MALAVTLAAGVFIGQQDARAQFGFGPTVDCSGTVDLEANFLGEGRFTFTCDIDGLD